MGGLVYGIAKVGPDEQKRMKENLEIVEEPSRMSHFAIRKVLKVSNEDFPAGYIHFSNSISLDPDSGYIYFAVGYPDPAGHPQNKNQNQAGDDNSE